MARILIVDDSALSRRILRRILEQDAHEVTEVEDGLTALERYYLERPDVVMLDLTMKGMSGLDVLDKLREIDRRCLVVVASADIQSSTKELATVGGARAFITKPFAPTDVLRTVQAVLAGGPE